MTLETEIDRLELRVLTAWVMGPSFRSRWTPKPDHFYTHRARALARGCAALAVLGVAGWANGDLSIALLEQLQRTGDLARHWKIGESPLPANGSSEPDTDLERWHELRLMRALRDSARAAIDGIGPGSALADVRALLLEAVTSAHVAGACPAHSLRDGTLAVLDAVRSPETSRAAPSGFDDLDAVTGGPRPGHVWVLGAPTNWGKTSWLIAVAMAQTSPVLLVTCEDHPDLIFSRLVARESGVSGTALRDRTLGPHDIGLVANVVASHQHRAEPFLLDGRGRAVEQIADDIRAHVSRHGIKLVLVDYIQCIGAMRKTQDRRAEINHVTRTLTDAIKTSGAAGILTSQLTGEDIRESRDVEHAAEVVLIGRKTKSPPFTLSVYVKKNKTGAVDGVFGVALSAVTGAMYQRDLADNELIDQLTDGFEESRYP
jgi:hypothetical protein